MLRVARLVLQDFKSFGGTTEMDLEPGVSVIVGRNGAGKSNLLDALRWVFGERDLATLRAGSLDDLCHRGGDGRARSCFVSALVASEDGADLSLGRGVEDGAEFYEVEGRPAVREEFLAALRGFDMPVPLFSVIRQGDVGRLLWLRPGERSALLAENLLDHWDRSDEELRDLERARLLTSLAPHPADPLLRRLLEELGLPPAAPGAEEPARAAQEIAALLEAQPTGVPALVSGTTTDHGPDADGEEDESPDSVPRRLAELRERVERRTQEFFRILVPGGEVALPARPASGPGELPGVGLAVRYPGKPALPLEGLSGGQRAILGLSLALAAFLERPSPALVLDEVEPALDDALVRRLSLLLEDVGRSRQIIVVSHQRIMRYSAGHVMHVERKGASSSIGLRYNPKTLRGPAAPAR